ncbi:sigma-70 family RNA polymerase sigma factor [Pedobacter paludis]|uniref:RNA polymerase subunit sigma n=1 Tax=Pedobacter paludis TaxID=2203212 RepID=A0A317EYZ1_9SPHI|nr:sigma-70 family RNA polymerase sigma factor [Pedobacter paludis]PWS30458.1 RNA polymerase subunit sigma [Pedobacter paludis]
MEKQIDSFTERKSFEELLLAEVRGLKSMARHFVNENDEIEDLVQDTLLKALRFYEKFCMETDIRKWLYTIMRNTFINRVKRTSRVMEHHTHIEIASRNSCSVSTVFSKFISDDVHRVINSFPYPLRQAITMYSAGYKYREISLATAQPIGTVKTRVRTARLILEKKFSPTAH